MRNNQLSPMLFRAMQRHFNERPGSTQNNRAFWSRMHLMYPGTVQRVNDLPYGYKRDEAIALSAKQAEDRFKQSCQRALADQVRMNNYMRDLL